MGLQRVCGEACLAAFFSAVTLAAAIGDGADQVTVSLGSSAETKSVVRTYGDGVPFNDCKPAQNCPEMVVVPAAPDGALVGSPKDEKGRLPTERQHKVTFKAFAIGKYEVSVREYLACVEAKGCRHPEWLEPDGQHNIHTGVGVTYKSLGSYVSDPAQPVVGVSWGDAAAYATWLSKLTGKTYRLPSETEWEYATRAGSTSAYWWGNDVQKDGTTMACCIGCGSDLDAKGFFPAKSQQANPWGLHNVHGNVWEWVQDYYCEAYTSGPLDGTARLSKTCEKQRTPEGLRIFRGGSCFYEPQQMRSAMRLRNWPKFRNQTVGFRVARDL